MAPLNQMVIFIAAGGTGGHIIPAIAVADAIREKRPETKIVFLGTGKEIERKLVQGSGYKLEAVELLPFSGKGASGMIKLALSLPGAVIAIGRLFGRERPAAIAGFGGYPSFLPVVVAAARRIPRIINEQNVKVGIANRFLSLLCTCGFAVPGAYGFLSPKRIASVPNPVRRKFFEIPDWQEPADGAPLRLLVVGGSQGAVSLNSALLQAAAVIKELGFSLTHQTGTRDRERVEQGYRELDIDGVRCIEFIDDPASAYAQADIVICRAGAMTVAEICAAGRAAIFVPLAIAGGHQAENAAGLVDAGAAMMVKQDDSAGARLGQILRDLAADRRKIADLASKTRQAAQAAGARSSEIVADRILRAADSGR